MNRTARRALVAAIAGPVLATGLFLTTAPAQAVAAVGDSTCSNSMAMPQIKAAPAPSKMTRAGQIAGGSSAPRSDAAMGSACPTAGHA